LNDDDVLRAHLAQMAKSVSPAYGLIAAIADPEAQREAGLLVDFVVSEQLSPPASLDLGADEIRTWRLSVEAAKPDRKCIGYLLQKFPAWSTAVSSTARAAFLETFPKLAPAAYDLNDEGMRLVIESVNVDPALLACVAEYAMTTAESVRAAARMAHRAADQHCTDLMRRLVETFPAQRVDESREAENLLPSMGKALQAAPDEAWQAGMLLALELVARDISSARGTLESLAGVLSKMPVAQAVPYLEDFRMMVEHIGIRINRLCLMDLPQWYARHGVEKTRAFVSCACLAAESFGVVAGQHFAERKTAAAKEMLP
jgi:hypothetical protein